MARTALRDRRLPGNPASAVYGTIVAAGQLAIESATDNSTPQIIGSLTATLIVFWLAHAYTDTLGVAITAEGANPSFGHALRAEWPIAESGIIPVAALLLAAAFGAHPDTAAVIALVVTAVELVAWAALAARRGGASGLRLVVASAVAGAFGVVLVALKFLIH